MRSKFITGFAVVCALIFSAAMVTAAQLASVPSRISQAVDENSLVTLKGNTHPTAAPQFDRGEASGSPQMNRMLLVLQHTVAQEAAIKRLLADQQNQASPNFHNWLTPQQYGQMFGRSDQDIQTITTWLQSHGFEVANVAPGRHVIEFSGAASQVQEAFHTTIHHYSLNGEEHWANSNGPQIPAALAPVVVGVKSLYDFRGKPTSHFTGLYRRDKGTGARTQISGPQFTFASEDSTFLALGPTDFGGNFFDPAAYWSATHDPTTQASALRYIPDLPWNNSCTNSLFAFIGFSTDPIANRNSASLAGFPTIAGGSGGASSWISSNGTQIKGCTGGYAKPSWPTGVGVPADGLRDVPDVSLYASTGFLESFYIICEADLSPTGMCDLNPPFGDFAGFGGTSVPSPAFAGILALLDQKTHARQGNANFVFYKLAAGENLANCNVNGNAILTTAPATSCIFNDITADTNAVPCAQGSPNCGAEGTAPIGVLTGYTSGVGFDLTTGLGSVNAANLVNNWKSVTFTPTVTLLKVSPEFLIHEQAENVDVAVIANGGTPSGQIALKTNNQDPAGDLTLGANGTIKTTTHLLPGGPTFVTADYFGDGTFARSDSNAVPILVLPEPSTTKISFFSSNAQQTGKVPFTGGGCGSIVFLRADVAGRSGFGAATGSVFLSDDRRQIPGNPYKLNSEGNTLTPNSINTFSVGTHTIRASYSGDSSFLPNEAQPASFLITEGVMSVTLTASPATAAVGASVALTATVGTSSLGNPPTGKVTFTAGGKKLGTVTVTASNDPNTGLASATASISTTSLPAGADAITATYSGDQDHGGAEAAISATISTPENARRCSAEQE
jgi:hypothetical protein